MPHDERRFRESLDRAYATACDALLAERNGNGFWLGELSSSALATATAISSLSLANGADSNPGPQVSNLRVRIAPLIAAGLRWLAGHQNADGGWGDTSDSFSNISTTMLVRAAIHLAEAAESHAVALDRATAYIDKAGGAAAVAARYGKDRTFAAPILANCALAGQAEWRDVAPLPFELAALPHGLFRFLRLHVVSYALPALIAIGQLIHMKRPTWNLLARVLRRLAVGPTLRKLEAIQPTSGGFLEAIPLTSFVVMSLAAAGRANHPVVAKGVDFLFATARDDGSWPIDSNLSIWLTTLSINALAAAPDGLGRLSEVEQSKSRDWLLSQQLSATHSYTNAAPGGWGWSHLSGSVPDADDTAGAILALARLPHADDVSDEATSAATRGISWLLVKMQNSDGGWPTFCRGWGKLPFDRSGTDLTAHVLRAGLAWRPAIARESQWFDEQRASGHRVRWSGPHVQSLDSAVARAFEFLSANQGTRGDWTPLWFGNQFAPGDGNPTYGTSRVLLAYHAAGRDDSAEAIRGRAWLQSIQNQDGGWGGDADTPSSLEETSIAVEAMIGNSDDKAREAASRGVNWLVSRVESGDWRKPSPIGLYFAKLWYSEKLYPLIFTVAALGRARRVLTH